MVIMNKTITSINKFPSSQLPETTNTRAKRKADKSKGGRPRMPIWDNYNKGEDDGHRHFRASCRYCDKGRWQRGKPSTMEAHLELHCSVLDGEIARIVVKMEAKLQKTDNLTLSLDGWTSPRGDSVYNYIVTTPSRHEYLYTIADYSGDRQTGNFIANKISDIIEKIGSHRFAIVVTDNGSNVRIARQSIHHDYSHILSIHCIAHVLNLLAVDLVKNTSIKEILKQANMPAIDKILEEQPEIFTNQEVFEIVNDENDNFYTSCRRIALIFEPIKRVITLLESRTASLADCFLGIIQLAATFRRIPTSNNFRHGLQKGKFCDICEMAVNYYKDLHHNEKECRELVSQLIKFKANATPWDLEFSFNLTLFVWWGVVEDEHTHLQELAKTMFAIVPSQANCEQNFSILKWFSEGRRTQLHVSQLESMAQIYSFYVSNVKKELNFCDDNFVEMELRNSVFNETIFAEINGPDLRNDDENEEEIVNPMTNEITMAFQDWVDMSDPIFGLNNNQDEIILTKEESNMNFESRSLVQDVLNDSDLDE
ncbi:15659_t:CDS:2 [Gigaspora margarita]|uniref:15659_t:CDS:1 n=1 Tax=Gigaspora margarita TaxID=4874 RepID=A0ABN7W077_GIGMA|nr:15659_t:CDS:2 [Gigaspora margarita]